MNILSKIVKLVIVAALFLGLFWLYRMDGFVDIRWKDSIFSGSLVAFACLAFIANILLYQGIRFLIRLGNLPSVIQKWWESKRESSAREILEKSFAYRLMEMPEKSIRFLQMVPDQPKHHFAKQLLTIYAAEQDQQFPNVSIAQELSAHPGLGFLGYKLWIEALIRSQDKKTAWIVLEKALKTYHSIGWFWAQLSTLASEKNKHRDAIEYARKAIKCDPKFSSVLAIAYFLYGKTEDKVKNWELAKAADPSNAEIVLALTKAYLEQKKSELAQKLIIKSWRLCSSSELGRLFLLTFEEGSSAAIETTLRLISENKDSLENQVLLIQACIKANYPQQARDFLTKAIKSFGLTKELLLLRVHLTEIDRAEDLDSVSWIKQLL